LNIGYRSSHRPQPQKPTRRRSNNSCGFVGADEALAKGNSDLDQPDGIDKSVLVIATPRR
jgi:hypothetical protein